VYSGSLTRRGREGASWASVFRRGKRLRKRAVGAASGANGAIHFIRSGCGNIAKIARRRRRSTRGRAHWRSTCARVSSMSLSYRTPDGHAVTHDMQPRQLSHALTCAADIGPASSWPARMSRIRPRGESISSPHSTYVGHVGRQKPQCTQSSMSSGGGGLRASKAVKRAAIPG
jgi:hypothetical protein